MLDFAHQPPESGESLAIVVDEYGSISGLISQEDLIETVVGEISDRRDAKSLYTRSTEDVIIASGKLELSEFREIFGIPLKTQENILTFGGWLIEQLGDIPTPGTKVRQRPILILHPRCGSQPDPARHMSGD